MKRILLYLTAGLCTLALAAAALFAQAQNTSLPRLAVAAFSTNISNDAIKADAITVRNLAESEMVRTRKFQMITRDEIDKLLSNQRIQVTDIASAENIKKLQLENIGYIVTGSIDYMDGNYAITVRVLDVATGQYSHSDNDFVECNPKKLYDGVKTLMAKFTQGMDSDGDKVVQTGPGQGQTGRGGQAAVPANFALVEGGTFQMGSTDGENDEKPVHTVTVKSFYMAKYEVTQKEWVEVMGGNPSNWKGENLPVEMVSWIDAIKYCNERSQKERLTPVYRGAGDSITCDWEANGYRLPTEAEWEYAARGGNKDLLGSIYSGGNSADAVAWYSSNSGSRTQVVMGKQGNSLGIYDMSGNVGEWCWDWWGSGYYAQSPSSDPRGPASGSYRVLRGGNWYFDAQLVRSASRGSCTPTGWHNGDGFRLVRNVQ